MPWPRRTTRLGNTRIQHAGRSFHSKLEAAVYDLLQLRQKAGEIQEIHCQDHIYLSDARIGCIPDFKCQRPDGSTFWVEAKGFPNDRWPIIKKLWKHYGPGTLEIWRGTYAKPKIDEIIVPVKRD